MPLRHFLAAPILVLGALTLSAAAAPGWNFTVTQNPDGSHILGNPKAKVKLTDYVSYTCSHCAHFHAQILPDLKKKWIDTGKVKLVYRDFPLDQVAVKAAQIAECAGKDKYFGVLDIIFRSQPQWATGADPLAELAKPLRIAGLGEAEIKACLANDAMMAPVLNDYRSGEALGVSATPTLFIGGQLYRGSRSVEDIDGAISKVIK